MRPQRTDEHRNGGQRGPANLDPEHEQHTGNRFDGKDCVSQRSRQSDRCEVLRRAGEREHEVFQDHAMRDEHEAERNAQKRIARLLTVELEHDFSPG